MTHTRIVFAAILAFLWVGRPVAAAELDSEVLRRVRDHVATAWTVDGIAEAQTRIGFSGTFRPKTEVELPVKCDGGPVGVVTYTTSEKGVVCAVYPRRDKEGTVRTTVALSAPGELIQEFDPLHEGGSGISKDGVGVMLFPNPDNETPEMKAAAAKSDAMAACQPQDIQQAVACLDAHWPAQTKTEFAALAADDLIVTHFGIGMWIRNNWGLWQGGALRDFFTRQNIYHPDTMSGLVLNAYWLKSHGCNADWNDTAAISTTFSLALNGRICPAS